MKIVYDAALFPGVGGGPRHFVGLSSALSRAGAHVVRVLPVGSPAAENGSIGELVELPCWANDRVKRQFMYELSRARLILRFFLKRRRFDVWMSRHSVFGVGFLLAKLVAERTVLEVNGPVKEEMRANFGSPLAAWVADRCFAIQLRGADIVLPVTSGLGEYVSKRNSHVAVHILPNGADPIFESENEDKSIRSDLVFAGAMTPWYDLVTVIDAIDQLRKMDIHVSLAIAGDGVRRSEVEERIAYHGLEGQVRLLGWVDSKTVCGMLMGSKVGILPLLRKSDELDVIGSPLKLYEYAAAGLQVVGTRVDGIEGSPVSSIVHTYPSGDPSECAMAIRDALSSRAQAAPPTTWSWDARAQSLLRRLYA